MFMYIHRRKEPSFVKCPLVDGQGAKASQRMRRKLEGSPFRKKPWA